MKIDKSLKKVEKFIISLKKTDVVELLWEKDGMKIGFKKEEHKVGNTGAANEHVLENSGVVPEEIKESVKLPVENNYKAIKSRMVGTFYISATPDSLAYVKEGDRIKSGQRICMIEAMKVMREISIDENARVVKILIENGHPVEYNQDMFLIEPLG